MQSVKLFIGLLSGFPDLIPRVRIDLEALFGPVDLQSGSLDFDYTSYYRPTMGAGLKRVFFSFDRLIDPAELASIKRRTIQLEAGCAAEGWPLPRPVNLDPGYLEPGKLVLATTKNHAHRIYLRDGIYAEVTLSYRNHSFCPFDWTYPDYRSSAYHDYFEGVRRILCRQLREQLPPQGASGA